MQRKSIADDTDIAAGSLNVGLPQRQSVFALRHLTSDQAICLFVLQEHHGVVVADGALEQPLGIVGSAGGHHLEPRSVEEVRFDVLRMEQSAPYAAAVWNPDGHRNLQSAVGPVAGSGRLADELIDRGPDEIGELDLRDCPLASECGSESDADYGSFGQWRVDDPVFAELFQQALGGEEHASTGTHVFTHHEHGGIALHFLTEGFPYGFNNAFYCHRSRLLSL